MEALAFLNNNDHTFLNLSMPACKCTMDPVFDVPCSTVVATMCRNGTDFGIRIAGLGPEAWFTAPAGDGPRGCTSPDLTMRTPIRIWGTAASPRRRGSAASAWRRPRPSSSLWAARCRTPSTTPPRCMRSRWGRAAPTRSPPWISGAAPPGIDLLKVVETGIRPIINTGIAHKDYGVGQVGAGAGQPPGGVLPQGHRGLRPGVDLADSRSTHKANI